MSCEILLRRRSPIFGLFAVITPLLGLLVGCTSPPPAQRAETSVDAPGLAARLDSILGDGRATVALRVVDLGTRRELYAREIDRPMMPASNMKLVTSATTLDTFGADHVF